MKRNRHRPIISSWIESAERDDSIAIPELVAREAAERSPEFSSTPPRGVRMAAARPE
jgi:hypothetical protein